MENEIWKDIKGYEGLYQVSNLGRVKSLAKLHKNAGKGFITKEKIIVGSSNSHGYKRVMLFRKKFFIHRLVAEAFVPNPNNYNVVNHKDFNILNNQASNLEWCTQKQNMQYSYREGRFAHLTNIRSKTGKKIIGFVIEARKRPVKQYDMNGNFIKKYNSITEASLFTKVDVGGITKVCKNQRNKAGGYIWRYEEDE